MSHYRILLRRTGDVGRFHVEKYIWDQTAQATAWLPCNVETTSLRLAIAWVDEQQAAELPTGSDGEYVVWQR